MQTDAQYQRFLLLWFEVWGKRMSIIPYVKYSEHRVVVYNWLINCLFWLMIFVSVDRLQLVNKLFILVDDICFCPSIYSSYAVGGYDGKTTTSTVESYDPRMPRWVMAESMNCARGYVATAVLGGSLYAIGGAITDDDLILDTVCLTSINILPFLNFLFGWSRLGGGGAR
jgi:Kelch motif